MSQRFAASGGAPDAPVPPDAADAVGDGTALLGGAALPGVADATGEPPAGEGRTADPPAAAIEAGAPDADAAADDWLAGFAGDPVAALEQPTTANANKITPTHRAIDGEDTTMPDGRHPARSDDPGRAPRGRFGDAGLPA
ncbi:MAG: hypothetical protein ACHQ3P_06435 [Candidatus Limnocylindrales bacterium]